MGDKINALLAGIGANLRKLLAFFWPALVERLQKLSKCSEFTELSYPCE